jgi:hypothetical protein
MQAVMSDAADCRRATPVVYRMGRRQTPPPVIDTFQPLSLHSHAIKCQRNIALSLTFHYRALEYGISNTDGRRLVVAMVMTFEGLKAQQRRCS